jgi:hypothetical protein
MDVSTVTSGALNVAIIVFSIIVVGGVGILGALIFSYWKKYQQFRIVIFERDGFGQQVITYDKGGVFVDSKTKNKRLFLQKNKVGLNPDKIPYITGAKGKRFVYLLRVGLKNFHYVHMNIVPPDIIMSVGEEDVNWAINAYEKSKKLFATSLLMQLMPYIALAFVTIGVIVIFMYLFKDIGVMKEVAVSLAETATQLAQINSGTTILT